MSASTSLPMRLCPSRGALRVLRQLAFYGSCGTAAAVTGFILEEQRRQICRLSKAVDNGKKLRKMMHQTQQRQQSTRNGFPGYIDSLESRDMLLIEPVQKKYVGHEEVPKTEQEYHYFTKIHNHSRTRRRMGSTRPPSAPPVEPANSQPQVTRTLTIRKRGRAAIFMKPSIAQTADSFTASNDRSKGTSSPLSRGTSLGAALRRRRRNNGGRLSRNLRPHPLSATIHIDSRDLRSVHDLPGEYVLSDFRLSIMNKADFMDVDVLSQFLSASSPQQQLADVEQLLNDCKAVFPWSKHLYPVLLRSLGHLDQSVYREPDTTISALSLCRRIFAEGDLDPANHIEDLYEAGAYQLILDIYEHHEAQLPWTDRDIVLFLHSALKMLASGSLDEKPLARLFHEAQNEPNFKTQLLSILRRQSAATGLPFSYHIITLKSLCASCSHDESPGLLGLLRYFFRNSRRNCRRSDDTERLQITISDLLLDPKVSGPWFHLLLSCYLSFAKTRIFSPLGRRRYDKELRKIIHYAHKRGHNDQLISIAQRFPRLMISADSATIFARAYSCLSEHQRVNPPSLSRLIKLCYQGESHSLVISLFSKFMHTDKLESESTVFCWNSLLNVASTENILDFLREFYGTQFSSKFRQMERIEGLLVRREWLRTRNTASVRELHDSILELNASCGADISNSRVTKAFLWACAKAGDEDQAQRIAQGMETADETTIHSLLLLQAKHGAWAKVANALDSLQRRGKMPLLLRSLDGSMTELFGLFCRQHKPAANLAFFKHSLLAWGVRPDVMMIDYLMASIIGKIGNQAAMRDSLELLSSQGYDWEIRPQTVVMAFYSYSTMYKPDSSHAVRFLLYLKRQRNDLVSKNLCRQVLEICIVAARKYRVHVGSVTKAIIPLRVRLQMRLEKQIATIEALAKDSPWLSELSSPSPSLARLNGEEAGYLKLSKLDKQPREMAQQYYVDMQSAMSSDEFEEVISIYRFVIREGLPRLHYALGLVIRACLNRSDPQLALEFVREAEAAGENVTTQYATLLAENFKDLGFNNWTTIRSWIFNYYEGAEKDGLHIDHTVLTMAAHSLIRERQALTDKTAPHIAIQLLNAVFYSKFGIAKPFEIAQMTCFLAAYTLCKDLAGVRWTMDTVLENNVLLDLHFFRLLIRSRKWIVPRVSGKYGGGPAAAEKWKNMFQTYDAIMWRRFEEQRKEALALGKQLASTLLQLSAMKNGFSVTATTATPRSRFRLRMEANARRSADISNASRFPPSISLFKNKQQQAPRDRLEKVQRRKADRVSQWQIGNSIKPSEAFGGETEEAVDGQLGDFGKFREELDEETEEFDAENREHVAEWIKIDQLYEEQMTRNTWRSTPGLRTDSDDADFTEDETSQSPIEKYIEESRLLEGHEEENEWQTSRLADSLVNNGNPYGLEDSRDDLVQRPIHPAPEVETFHHTMETASCPESVSCGAPSAKLIGWQIPAVESSISDAIPPAQPFSAISSQAEPIPMQPSDLGDVLTDDIVFVELIPTQSDDLSPAIQGLDDSASCPLSHHEQSLAHGPRHHKKEKGKVDTTPPVQSFFETPYQEEPKPMRTDHIDSTESLPHPGDSSIAVQALDNVMPDATNQLLRGPGLSQTTNTCTARSGFADDSQPASAAAPAQDPFSNPHSFHDSAGSPMEVQPQTHRESDAPRVGHSSSYGSLFSGEISPTKPAERVARIQENAPFDALAELERSLESDQRPKRKRNRNNPLAMRRKRSPQIRSAEQPGVPQEIDAFVQNRPTLNINASSSVEPHVLPQEVGQGLFWSREHHRADGKVGTSVLPSANTDGSRVVVRMVTESIVRRVTGDQKV